MIESQHRKLMEEYDKPYVSIGIWNYGDEMPVIGIPWVSHTGAMNMKTPHIWFEPDDFNNPDPEIMTRLSQLQVIGCYIYSILEDYSFLAKFPDLRDVHIRKGNNIRSLSFMREIKKCTMFYLNGATLDNLEDLTSFRTSRGARQSFYLGFANCRISNIDCLLDREAVLLDELVIVNPVGTDEKGRWKDVHAIQYTYREINQE